MDSNNPIPFLGFQLSEAKARKAESPVTVRATTPEKQQMTSTVNAPRRFNSWLNSLKSQERMSLPRTDEPVETVAAEADADDTSSAVVTAESVEFTADF